MKLEWNKFTILWDLSRKLKKEKLTKQFVCLISTKYTREMRTTIQNRMFKWLFSEIWKHLWYRMENIQGFFMKSLFWVKEIELFWNKQEVQLINSTKDLEKEQAIYLIDSILQFIEKHKISCKYKPRDVQSLYDSYN